MRERAEGFEAFVAERGPALLAVARGLVDRDADAEDLLHDALARALERWDRVLAADDRGAYVHRILVTTAVSRWRRAARRPERLVDPASLAIGPAAARAGAVGASGRGAQGPEERLAVMAALRSLPVRQRAVLVLRHLVGADDEAIAAALGCQRATVRSLAARAAAALRGSGLLDDDEPVAPTRSAARP